MATPKRKRPSEAAFRRTIKGLFCVYCGEWAQCLDHFPPYSATRFGFLLPACLECNGLAGTEYPFNFNDRYGLVKEKLAQKYKKVLSTPTWDRAELERLGYTLKTAVKTWQELRKIATRRIAWNAHAYLGCIATASDFVRLNAEISTMPEKEPVAFAKQFESSTQMRMIDDLKRQADALETRINARLKE